MEIALSLSLGNPVLTVPTSVNLLNGLQIWYRDLTAGGPPQVLGDFSGNSNDASQADSGTNVTGFVIVPTGQSAFNCSGFGVTGSYSVACIVQTSDGWGSLNSTGSDDTFIFFNDGGNALTSAIQSGTFSTPAVVWFNTVDGGDSTNDYTFTLPISPDEPISFVLTYDVSGTTKTYVNGVLVGSASADSGQSISDGLNLLDASGSQYTWLAQNLGVWDRVLSASEAAKLATGFDPTA